MSITAGTGLGAVQSTEYVIGTKGLSVYHGRHRGILDVDLRVEKGEVFGFLGPNGAGKTTTQRVLMDIIRPTTGPWQWGELPADAASSA